VGLLDLRLGEDLAHLLHFLQLDAALLLILRGELPFHGLLGERRTVGIGRMRRRGRTGVARVVAVLLVLAHLVELLLVVPVELVQSLLLLELLLMKLRDLRLDLVLVFLELLVLLLQCLAFRRLRSAAFVLIGLTRLQQESQPVVAARRVADGDLVVLEGGAVGVALKIVFLLVVGIIVVRIVLAVTVRVVLVEDVPQRLPLPGRGCARRRHVGGAPGKHESAERRPGVELDVSVRDRLREGDRYRMNPREPAGARHPVHLAHSQIPYPQNAPGLEPSHRRLAGGKYESCAIVAHAAQRAQGGLLVDGDRCRIPAYLEADRLHFPYGEQVLAQCLRIAAAQDVSGPGRRRATVWRRDGATAGRGCRDGWRRPVARA